MCVFKTSCSDVQITGFYITNTICKCRNTQADIRTVIQKDLAELYTATFPLLYLE